MTRQKTEHEIEIMRESGRMLASVLDLLKRKISIGATPKDMSALAAKELKALGGEPAFLGYEGYPDVICISVNEQVQHSIPSDRPFADGDVVNFDFGVKYNNLITDGGVTVGLGKLSADDERLINGTKEALDSAIKIIKDGTKIGDISAVIEAVLNKYQLGIVKELVGHGVGDYLHEDPEIPNHGHRGDGPALKSGMTIAVEPIANLGDGQIKLADDGWTLVSVDGTKAAQFEHTLLVTDSSAEILTSF